MPDLVVDAQVHVWRGVKPATRPEQLARHGGRAELTADSVLREMDAAGVAAAILIAPGWALDGNRSAHEGARRDPARFAVVDPLDPAAASAAVTLAGWTPASGVLGYRLVFSDPARATGLRGGAFDVIFEAAAASGCPLTVSAPESLPAIGRIARQAKGVRVTIDHLGLAAGTTGPALGPAIDDLRALAGHPNIAVKAASLPSYSAGGPPYADVGAELLRVIEAFGPGRVFWASDLTKHLGRYPQQIEFVRAALASLGERDRALVLGRGVCEWLGWTKPLPASALPSVTPRTG